MISAQEFLQKVVPRDIDPEKQMFPRLGLAGTAAFLVTRAQPELISPSTSSPGRRRLLGEIVGGTVLRLSSVSHPISGPQGSGSAQPGWAELLVGSSRAPAFSLTITTP